MEEEFDKKTQEKAEKEFESFKTYKYDDTDFEKIFKNESKLKKLIKKGIFGDYAEYISSFLEMLKDFFQGKYKEVPVGTIAAIISTLLYILSPIDLIPDWIPVVGWLDDIFILKKCISFAKKDIEKYRRWKEYAERLESTYTES